LFSLLYALCGSNLFETNGFVLDYEFTVSCGHRKSKRQIVHSSVSAMII